MVQAKTTPLDLANAIPADRLSWLKAQAPQLINAAQLLCDLARVETVDRWLFANTVEAREDAHACYRMINDIEQIFLGLLERAQHGDTEQRGSGESEPGT